jgi:hypothetical protein
MSVWGQVNFDVNNGRAARDGCNATWNLDGNTAFQGERAVREEKVTGEKRSTIYFKGWADIFPVLKVRRQIPFVLVLNVF